MQDASTPGRSNTRRRSNLAQPTPLGNNSTTGNIPLRRNNISLPPIQESPPESHGYSQYSIAPPPQSHQQPAKFTSPAARMQRAIPPQPEDSGPIPGPPSAATMAAQGLMAHDAHDPHGPHSPEDAMGDGRSKAKRELSQSKRAAQNRAAQRAFRQRKEHYIKKLESEVREFSEMQSNFKIVQNDNYALREYIIQCQSRLLDLQADLPPPPPGLNLTQPGCSTGPPRSMPPPPAHPPASVPQVGPNTAAPGTLADVAAAVADLSSRARDPAADPFHTKNDI